MPSRPITPERIFKFDQDWVSTLDQAITPPPSNQRRSHASSLSPFALPSTNSPMTPRTPSQSPAPRKDAPLRDVSFSVSPTPTNSSPIYTPSESVLSTGNTQSRSTSLSQAGPTQQDVFNFGVDSSTQGAFNFEVDPYSTSSTAASSPVPRQQEPMPFGRSKSAEPTLSALDPSGRLFPDARPSFQFGPSLPTRPAPAGNSSQSQPNQFIFHFFGNKTSQMAHQSGEPSGTTRSIPPPSPPSVESKSLPENNSVRKKDTVEPVPKTPYVVQEEEAPAHPFFGQDVQLALNKGRVLVSKLANLLYQPSQAPQDPTVRRILKDASELRTVHKASTRTIAVLGDSGEGKSSLINSLLHFPTIAKTGDIGSACTSVVTEYKQRAPGQVAPILIEVEYLSETELEEEITELLWSYRQLYQPLVQSAETNSTDYQQYEKQSAQAWSALEAAFKHHRRFNERFLRDESEGALERVKNQLLEWTREIQWPAGGKDGIWTTTADTAEECHEKTRLFMSEPYWPFTKIMRIHLDSHVLSTGLVLADLPGLHDTNLARVRATQDYLLQCNNILIVAKISRAITDQSLKSSLYSVLSRHVPLEWEESGAASLNIAVVCTKSEDINLEMAVREFCGDGKPIPASTMESLDSQIATAKSAGNRPLKKQLKQRREMLLIQARNEHVRQGLRNAYAVKVPNGRLDVFCVSNTMYEKHSRKGAKDIVFASEIPDLRKFCRRVTADAQLRESKMFLQSSMNSLLNSTELWANSVRVRNQATVLDAEARGQAAEAIGMTKVQGKKTINRMINDFSQTFHDLIHRSGTRVSHWQEAAAEKGKSWQGWHWSQYNAWCMNDGDHETPKRKHVNWNSEIIWKMRMELDFDWDFESDIVEGFKTLGEKTAELLGNLDNSLGDLVDVSFQQTLTDNIDARTQLWEYTLDITKEAFQQQMSTARRYAFESNYRSHVFEQMIPYYREARSISGRGTNARQISVIQGRLEDGILFPSICFAITENMDRVLDKIKEDLLKAWKGVITTIRADIELAMPTSEQSSHEYGLALDVDNLLKSVQDLKREADVLNESIRHRFESET